MVRKEIGRGIEQVRSRRYALFMEDRLWWMGLSGKRCITNLLHFQELYLLSILTVVERFSLFSLFLWDTVVLLCTVGAIKPMAVMTQDTQARPSCDSSFSTRLIRQETTSCIILYSSSLHNEEYLRGSLQSRYDNEECSPLQLCAGKTRPSLT